MGVQGENRVWGFSPERPAALPTRKKAATGQKPRCGLRGYANLRNRVPYFLLR